MKKYSIILLGVLLVLSAAFVRETRADNWSVSVSVGHVNDFYAPLARHGYWADVAPYGRCWYPAYVEHDWRPYTEGYWLWTDNGWYWESDEAWAWATYHYGRWVLDPYYGWVWAPDTVWGPAWVCWRGGGEYVGWAPLPPRCGFGPDGWLMTERVVIAPQWFVFVRYGRFCEPIHRHDVIINRTIVNETVNITKIRRFDHGIIDHGPDLDVVQRQLGHKLEVRPVQEIRQREAEWMSERSSLGHARVKLPSPILPATGELGREGKARRETAVATPREIVAPSTEHGRPNARVPIEKGAEVHVPEATRPGQTTAKVIVPQSELLQEPQARRAERNAQAEKPGRLEKNVSPQVPLGNYGNFPTGRAYGRPRSGQPLAPETVQPRASGGRTTGYENSRGMEPDRGGRSRD